jgi:hypothetical protein
VFGTQSLNLTDRNHRECNVLHCHFVVTVSPDAVRNHHILSPAKEAVTRDPVRYFQILSFLLSLSSPYSEARVIVTDSEAV